jgi:hypothetical protein
VESADEYNAKVIECFIIDKYIEIIEKDIKD